MERYFKLHGYLPDFQDRHAKRFVAVVQKDGNSDCVAGSDVVQNSENNDTVSLSHYNQLLSMYNQKSDQAKNDNNGKTALLAGNYCLISNFDTSWIIDSGSTDQICPTLANFQPMSL